MLDGVNADRAFGKGCGSFDGLHFGDIGIDEWFVREIDATKAEAVAFRCGLQGEGDFFSGVEGGTFEGGFGSQCVLHVRHGRGFKLGLEI